MRTQHMVDCEHSNFNLASILMHNVRFVLTQFNMTQYDLLFLLFQPSMSLKFSNRIYFISSAQSQANSTLLRQFAVYCTNAISFHFIFKAIFYHQNESLEQLLCSLALINDSLINIDSRSEKDSKTYNRRRDQNSDNEISCFGGLKCIWGDRSDVVSQLRINQGFKNCLQEG